MVSVFLTLLFMSGLFCWSVPALEKYLIVDKPLPYADALVVMAGSRSERLPAAANLYKKGIAPKILLANDGVFAAWSTEKQRNLFQVEWAELELMQMQVSEKAIVKLQYSSSGTIYDALWSRTIVLKKGFKSIIIVTSDYHTRRSLWTFKRVYKNYPVKIAVYPVRSKVTAMPCYKKFIPLSCELIKYFYYICKY